MEWSHATAALLAGVIRANSQSRAATRAELRKSQFRAIRRRIDRDIGDVDLGAATLVSQFFVTRPTLYRMFEPHGGIGKYILGRRLTGVFRDLSDPSMAHRQIGAVLRRWGLQNHTAAGRAFRAAYGMTPLQCRSRAMDLHRAGALGDGAVFDIPSEIPANVAAFQGSIEPKP
ncbi:MAG: AraC family transcriptional regulator [Caulobacteraceae bacterium]|nr:MAG: AraC family transcriptional regulator [Caulobacteraceae bacterium]